jgi:hypothetical protein
MPIHWVRCRTVRHDLGALEAARAGGRTGRVQLFHSLNDRTNIDVELLADEIPSTASALHSWQKVSLDRVYIALTLQIV